MGEVINKPINDIHLQQTYYRYSTIKVPEKEFVLLNNEKFEKGSYGIYKRKDEKKVCEILGFVERINDQGDKICIGLVRWYIFAKGLPNKFNPNNISLDMKNEVILIMNGADDTISLKYITNKCRVNHTTESGAIINMINPEELDSQLTTYFCKYRLRGKALETILPSHLELTLIPLKDSNSGECTPKYKQIKVKSKSTGKNNENDGIVIDLLEDSPLKFAKPTPMIKQLEKCITPIRKNSVKRNLNESFNGTPNSQADNSALNYSIVESDTPSDDSIKIKLRLSRNQPTVVIKPLTLDELSKSIQESTDKMDDDIQSETSDIVLDLPKLTEKKKPKTRRLSFAEDVVEKTSPAKINSRRRSSRNVETVNYAEATPKKIYGTRRSSRNPDRKSYVEYISPRKRTRSKSTDTDSSSVIPVLPVNSPGRPKRLQKTPSKLKDNGESFVPSAKLSTKKGRRTRNNDAGETSDEEVEHELWSPKKKTRAASISAVKDKKISQFQQDLDDSDGSGCEVIHILFSPEKGKNNSPVRRGRSNSIVEKTPAKNRPATATVPKTPKTPKTTPRAVETVPKTPKSQQYSSVDGAKTPSTVRRLVKPATLTPSVQARVTAVKETSTPLNRARMLLHVAHVPDALPCREREYSDVLGFVEGKLLDGCGGCMYISGVPGTGKTATVTEVIRQLQIMSAKKDVPSFDYVSINGMRLTEPRQSYVEILKQLTGKTHTWEQAQSMLDAKFTKKGKKSKPIVLLVDELDILCTKRQDVVYNLLDWPSKAHAQLIVITIANTMDLPERLLMGRVTSRLGLTRLTFQAYNHKQLQEIVCKRLLDTNTFNPDAVQLVARKVASVSGDARRALDICRRAAEIAESTGKDTMVSMLHVSEALNSMITQPKVRAIKCCSRLEQLVLQAVVSEVERTGVEETTFMDIYTMLVSIAALDGFQMVSMTLALSSVSRLGACRLLLTEQKTTDISQRLILNVSADDVFYALRKD